MIKVCNLPPVIMCNIYIVDAASAKNMAACYFYVYKQLYPVTEGSVFQVNNFFSVCCGPIPCLPGGFLRFPVACSQDDVFARFPVVSSYGGEIRASDGSAECPELMDKAHALFVHSDTSDRTILIVAQTHYAPLGIVRSEAKTQRHIVQIIPCLFP